MKRHLGRATAGQPGQVPLCGLASGLASALWRWPVVSLWPPGADWPPQDIGIGYWLYLAAPRAPEECRTCICKVVAPQPERVCQSRRFCGCATTTQVGPER